MLVVLLWADVAKMHQENTGNKLQATEWWKVQTHCSHAWPCRALQHVPGKFLTAHIWLLELFRTVHQCYEQQCLILHHYRRQQPRKAEGQGSVQVHRYMGILHAPTCAAMAFWDATSQDSRGRNTTELSQKGRWSHWSDISHLLLIYPSSLAIVTIFFESTDTQYLVQRQPSSHTICLTEQPKQAFHNWLLSYLCDCKDSPNLLTKPLQHTHTHTTASLSYTGVFVKWCLTFALVHRR